MRLKALPSYWDKSQGLDLMDVQDIDLHLSIVELEHLADFFAKTLADAQERRSGEYVVDFGDSKPNPQTGIVITVLLE